AEYKFRVLVHDSWDYSDEAAMSEFLFERSNAAPATPTGFELVDDPVEGPLVLTSTMVLTNIYPELSAIVSDADGPVRRAEFSVWRDGILIADKVPGSHVDNGQRSTLTLPFALEIGSTYTFKVWGSDSLLRSTTALDPGITVRIGTPTRNE